MEISLSWDLFVIVFFSVIIAYSFIIGRNQSIKIIISAYIAILTADGVGNLIERYLLGENPIIRSFDFDSTEGRLVLIKIIIFILGIVLITTRGKFNIDLNRSKYFSMELIMSLAYGILSAGLITSTILIYAAGGSFVQSGELLLNNSVLEIYQQSQMVRLMINNYNVWFSIPAIAFVVSSFFGEED